MTQTTYNS